MKTTHAFSFAVLVIPLTLAFAAAADDLSFHPAKGEKVEKELRVEGEFHVKDVSVTVNGDPLPGEALDQISSMDLLLSLGIDASETFVSTKDGAPSELLRTYDDISVSMEVGDKKEEPVGSNALEGKTVRFQWDDENSEYKKSFHESTGDEALLENLIDDMEVRALLPTKKVATGDTWEVPAEHMTALFFPGGIASGSGNSSEGGPEFDALSEALHKQIEAGFGQFKVTCTYKGAREADGVQVGEIAFVFDDKGTLDLGSMLDDARGLFGGDMPDMDMEASATLSLKGEGTLLWDLSTGHMHAYEMRSDVGLDIHVDLHLDSNGEKAEVSMSGSLGGDVTWELKHK